MAKLLLILGVLAALALPAAGYVAMEAYIAHAAQTQRLEALRGYARALQANERARARYRVFLDQAREMVAEAQRVGADPQGWDRYGVSLQRPVAFAELGALLRQADHGPGYYFKPELLHVRLPEQEPLERGRRQAEGENEELPTLTLQGVFLVRRR